MKTIFFYLTTLYFYYTSTVPITHHIRIGSPRGVNGPNLSLGLEPSMKRWGTEWGLRDKPALPISDSNSSLGVDMSSKPSPRKMKMFFFQVLRNLISLCFTISLY